MAQYIYTMNGVGKRVDQRNILKNISLSFFPGAKIGVLGINGSGKSSLLRIMAGVDTQFEGEARAQSGIKIGYLEQEPSLSAGKSVRETVEEGVAQIKALLTKFDDISMRFAEPMSDEDMNQLLVEQGDLQNAIESCGGWELDRILEVAAEALRLPDWDACVDNLSGGERRRVALCRLLISNPDMLLLDEPTNHLDAESVAWLERYLEEFQGTVVAITHDRYFLDNAAEWILELDRGEGIPYKGNYTAWLEQKEARLEMEKKQEASHQRTIKALNFILPKGGILGIIGSNGAGKSTFLKMLTGQETPDSGEIIIGQTVQMAFVDQMRDSLNGDKTIWEDISEGQDIMKVGNFEMPSRSYLGRFNFKGADQQKKISTLSGGERNRVHLAKLLKSGANVLLLDEPSNDLDVETLRALEEAILGFPGCAIVVSHDRWFLDRICTHLMAFEGNSEVVYMEGNYSDYEIDRKKRLGADAAKPKRIKYRRLEV